MARDLINTPSNDMGPDELAGAARKLAAHHGAEVRVIAGDDLLGQNFPLIHVVGCAAARAPCLIDLSWGDPAARKITLVGKGVCFDSGGRASKPEAALLLMKKGMGGAASVFALSQIIIDRKLADMNNVATGGFAGSIVCALFLNRFVTAAKAWLHFDIYAWTPAAKAGRPEGGECQAARALYALLTERYG